MPDDAMANYARERSNYRRLQQVKGFLRHALENIFLIQKIGS